MKPAGTGFYFCLSLLRLLLGAWVGAAVLFVITSVAEQTSPQFDSIIRDHLATIRFPLYYKFGFAIHGVGVLLSFVLCVQAPSGLAGRCRAIASLIVCATIMIGLDHQLVYLPLQELITPPGSVRTTEFQKLHKYSEYANTVHVLLMLIAAIIASRSVSSSKSSYDVPS